MRLDSLTRPELIFPALEASDRDEVLRELARHLREQAVVSDDRELFDRLLEREALGSTGIGAGVAIPHCKMKRLSRAVLAVGVSRRAIDFGAMDSEPVRLFFLVVSPTDEPAVHLQVLASLSRWIKADRHVARMLDLDDPDAMYRLLEEEA